MAVSELMQTAKYNLTIEKFRLYSNSPERLWKIIHLKPASSYKGVVKGIKIFCDNDYHALGLGHIVNEHSPSYPTHVYAYSPYELFQEFYHILQTEAPCYFYFSSDQNYPTPGIPGHVPLARWYLSSSDEPLGEGPVDQP